MGPLAEADPLPLWPDDPAGPLLLPEPEPPPIIASLDAAILPGADADVGTALVPDTPTVLPLPALAEQALPGPQQILVQSELPSLVPDYPALLLRTGQHADPSVLDAYLNMDLS